MLDPVIRRARNIIDRTIQEFKLDLQGEVVLTEVGSNNYLFTPLIPALAGAKVIAWTKDTGYGSADEIVAECEEIAGLWGIKSKITFRKNIRPNEDIISATIVTNSGMIRPINAEMIKNFSAGAVVPLMFEAWELRDEDIDINACKKFGVKVAGTWENHPMINVFEYTGILALKLILNSGIEVYESNIMIWSKDEFGENAKHALLVNGAKEVILSTKLHDFYNKLEDLDALFLCDYHSKEQLFGENGIFDIDLIKDKNPALTIVHLFGKVDAKYISDQLRLYPDKNGNAQIMSETLAYVGLEPILRLQVAGFTVGKELITGKHTKLSQIL